MEYLALGRAEKRRGKERIPGGLETEPSGAEQAPAASVLWSADLEQVPTTAPAANPLTGSQTILVGVYFFVWYTLNIGYNITNRRALHSIGLPWSILAAQLIVGSIYVLPLWMLKLRAAPRLTIANVKNLSPIAACHMLCHVCTVVGLGAGAVSFVHIIKATEPLFTALMSAIFLKQTFSPLVYLTLLPVVAGVGLTAFKEFDLNLVAFIGAVGYNLAASTRAALSKRSMGTDMGKNMTPANLYAVVNTMASAMLLPLLAIVEGPRIKDVCAATFDSPEDRDDIIFDVVASGVFFYLFNEVAFRCLGRVHPVTHAVGNTFKRVFLMATSFIVFKSTLTPMTVVGSCMATVGVLLYRLTGG